MERQNSLSSTTQNSILLGRSSFFECPCFDYGGEIAAEVFDTKTRIYQS